ncbi:hypothetical protein LCGC14_3091880, partial [marine sediment metagenome]
MLLSGDIGGTNTRLALYEYNKPLKLIKEERFLSSNYSTLLNAIHAFLKNENVKIEAASFGVAGPVRDGKCQATNLPWLIDIHEIAKDLNISKAYLLNDLDDNPTNIPSLEEIRDNIYTMKGMYAARDFAGLTKLCQIAEEASKKLISSGFIDSDSIDIFHSFNKKINEILVFLVTLNLNKFSLDQNNKLEDMKEFDLSIIINDWK